MKTAVNRRKLIVTISSVRLWAGTVSAIVYPIVEFLIPPAMSEASEANVVAASSNELRPGSKDLQIRLPAWTAHKNTEGRGGCRLAEISNANVRDADMKNGFRGGPEGWARSIF